MQKLVEVKDEGFHALIGKKVTLMCANYFYTGELEGVNKTCVKLKNPSIVYDTGDWSKPNWADAQKLPTDALYVRLALIESFGVLKQ